LSSDYIDLAIKLEAGDEIQEKIASPLDTQRKGEKGVCLKVHVANGSFIII